MKKPRYQYQALGPRDLIRIFTIDPGQGDDPITGTLEVVPIDAVGNYEAVSYVWVDPGPAGTPYDICIRDSRNNDEGVLELAGGSLFAALRQMRCPDKPRRLWADQCCINQDDLVERSQQVQFMNKIYQNATNVLVWLGLDTDHKAKPAFDLVHELDDVLKNHPVGGSMDTAGMMELEKHVERNRSTLQALTERPWFKRGWIVQEVGTSTPATMLWGEAEIEWEKLAMVCERLKNYHHLRSKLAITTSDISFLFRRFVEPDDRTHHANRFNFVYELQRSRHLRFSDDRDRIFAFLGHFSTRLTSHPLACGYIPIMADYTKSVEETYTSVAVELLRANPATFCILLASAQHSQDTLRSSSRLPSWVPDWRRSEGIILAEPICPHQACGPSTASIDILGGQHPTLRIQGVKIDSIEECSQPLVSSDFYGNNLPDKSATTIETLWHRICGKEEFNLDDKYKDNQTATSDTESAFFAFMQTLANGCVQAAGHDCQSYHDIPETKWLKKAAKHVVETLGASEDVAEDIKRVAGCIEESHHSNWGRWAASASSGRIFARTKSGYYVLGPIAMEAGDVVCVLYGAKVPFVLRAKDDHYLLVGDCYAHRLMNGEAINMVDREEFYAETFSIA